MHQAKDKSPLPLPDVLNEDLAVSSQKRDGLSNSHTVHIHVDPILSVASTSFCKTHPNHSDKHSIKISSDPVLPIADGNSSCQDQLLPELFKLDNSAACSDSTCDDSDEDRPGSFDYMPMQKGHVRIAPAVNPSYDEEVKLGSSTASSVIESPRSDDSHTEDKADVTDAGKDVRRKHKHTCWDYMPHCGQKSDDDDEDTNDDEEDSGDRGIAGSGSSLSSSFPRTTTKEVDECVSYNLKSLNGPSTGQLNGPSTGQNNQLITPLSYSLYQDRWMSEDSKEKDKKRGRSKDDTDKSEVSAQVDGNPRLLDPATNYLQMHQWPRNKVDSTATRSLSSYPPLTISHSHASSAADPNAFDRKKERRRMKLERLKGTPAEEIQGHRKFNDIKEILAFVEGTNASRGDIKPTKKKLERRKRDHHLEGPHELDDTVGGDDSQNKEESFVVTASIQSVPRAMGNSFRRSFDENISKSLSEDEDVDKNNGEFHDCLSTLPAEYATANSEQQQKVNGFLVAIEKTYPIEGDHFDAFSAEDGKTEKHVADSVGKKSAKSKTKKERQESASNNHGNLTVKSTIVMRKDSLEMKDSLLVKSLTCVDSVKSETASGKEPHMDMKREDSFTEVKKRKKRPGVKDVNAIFPGHFSKSYNNSYGGGGISYHRFQHRTSTPPPTPVTLPAGSQVVTLPAGSQVVTLPTGSQTHALRDLSPSAFPVLPGQGQPLSLRPEARRNSCGDLNSDSLDSRTYDSDRESAKSLPAAHGAAAGGDILPAYPLSYARIAAAPRKNDNTCNTSLESSAASITQNSSVNCSTPHASGNIVLPPSSASPAVTPERKTTVWKGSPRERRHSIGSSPKDKVEEAKTSVAEKNRQCGSQEVLSKNTVSSASKAAQHATVSSSVVKQVQLNENSSSTHTNHQTEAVATPGNVAFMLTDGCTPMEAKPTSQSTGNTNTAASDTGSPEYAISSSLRSAQDLSTTAALHPVISSQPGCASTASEAQKEVDIELSAVKSTQEACALASSVRSQTLPSAETNTKTAINKSRQNCHTDAARRNPKKSVIFLDRRFDSSPPQNLGITFGFDSSYVSGGDTASQPTSHQLPFPSHHLSLPAEIALSSSKPSSSPLPPPPSSQSCQHFPAPAVSRGHPHIPPASHPAAVPSANSLLFTSSPLPQSSENIGHPPKGPHIHRPCNGLIFPSSLPRRASVDQSQITSDNNTSGGNNRSSVRSNYCASYQETASSGRTNSSELKSGEMDNLHVTSEIHKKEATAVFQTVDQLNTTLPHAVISNKHTTSADLNSSVATLPHTDPSGVDREASILPLPSAQDIQEAASPLQDDLESVLREGGQDPALAKADTVDSAVSSSTTALSKGGSDSQQQKQDLGEPPAARLLTMPVVYGLKIKSEVGCGKLLFVPSCVSKKNRGNSEEMCSFLRRRWLEEVTQKRGAETFTTLSNN